MTTARRGIRTSEFWAVAASVVGAAVLLYLLRHWAAMLLPAAPAVYAWSRAKLKRFTQGGIFTGILTAAINGKGNVMIETWIETQLKALTAKAFAGLALTAAEQAIVDAAVVANVKLALLLVEKEGAKLLAKSHPELATALAGVIGPVTA